MFRRVALCLMVAMFLTGTLCADSIRLDKKWISGITVFKTDSRYYFRLPGEQGQARSIGVNQIKAEHVIFGDEAPPEIVEPSVLGPQRRNASFEAGAATIVLKPAPASLEANALVLSSAGSLVAFCAVDVMALDANFRRAVLAELAAQGSKIDNNALLLAATGVHTNIARGCLKGLVNELLFGDFDTGAFEGLAKKIAGVIVQAEQQMSPAQLKFGELDAGALHKLRKGGSSAADSSLSFLGIESVDGKALASLVNFAIEPPPFFNEDIALNGLPVSPDRGIPGGVALKLRESLGASVPVLFFNGASGDVEPNFADGKASPEQQKALGGQIAQKVLDALSSAQPRSKIALAAQTREVALPPSILEDILAQKTTLQEFYIDDIALLSMPGVPAAEIGALLRMKGLKQDAEGVFLLGCANDYFGFQASPREFLSGSEYSFLNFHGPLMGKWYLDNQLVSGEVPMEGAAELWKEIPFLAQHEAIFAKALSKGAQEKTPILEAWNESYLQLEKVANLLQRTQKDKIPQELAPLLERLSDKDAKRLAAQVGATFIRKEFAEYEDADWTLIMGAAEGAVLPFDAAMLLQLLAKNEKTPEKVAAFIVMFKFSPYDFMAW